MVDSAFLWALVLGRLRAGHAMGSALARTIAAVEAAGGTGRFNFLLTDGHSIAATACGDTLWYRQADASAVVASEPFDDRAGWTEVPDRHLLTATAQAVSFRPLAATIPAAPAPPPPAGGSAAVRHAEPMNTRTGSHINTEGIFTG